MPSGLTPGVGYRFSEKDHAQTKGKRRPDAAKLDRALAVVAARRLLLDGDFGIADRHHAERQRAAEPANNGAKRHERKEHQHSAIAFKLMALKISIQASPAPMPSAAPPSTPSTRPSRTSNAIFMDVILYGCLQSLVLVVAGASEVQR
jgi:hypothetical protein